MDLHLVISPVSSTLSSLGLFFISSVDHPLTFFFSPQPIALPSGPSFCASSSSSSFSIRQLSQFCFTLCPTVLCTVDLASSCALEFSLMPSTTFWAISFLILLSPLFSFSSSSSLPLSSVLLPGNLPPLYQAAPSATSAHSIPVSPCLSLPTTK